MLNEHVLKNGCGGKRMAARREYLFFLKQEARGYWLSSSDAIKENPSEEVV